MEGSNSRYHVNEIDMSDMVSLKGTKVNNIETRVRCFFPDDSGVIAWTSDNEIEKDAVRPKRDMDAETSVETENENDAVCPECDDEAAAVDEDATNKQEKNANEGAAAAKKILEENDEVTNEDVESRRLID